MGQEKVQKTSSRGVSGNPETLVIYTYIQTASATLSSLLSVLLRFSSSCWPIADNAERLTPGLLKPPAAEPRVANTALFAPDLALILSIMAFRRSSTEPFLTILPLIWPLLSGSSISKGSDRPAVLGELKAGGRWFFLGVMVIEAEEGDVNWAIKLVDGNAELEGSWGSGSIGMGGIVDRVDVPDVVGVGRTIAPGGFKNISIFKRQ